MRARISTHKHTLGSSSTAAFSAFSPSLVGVDALDEASAFFLPLPLADFPAASVSWKVSGSFSIAAFSFSMAA